MTKYNLERQVSMDFIKICQHAMHLVNGISNVLIAKKFGVGAAMYY